MGVEKLNNRMSLSARRAWIEIVLHGLQGLFVSVALRKESVDRNSSGLSRADEISVALRKESVDRNLKFSSASLFDLSSLSARRAWIEITSLEMDLPRYGSRSPQGERG